MFEIERSQILADLVGLPPRVTAMVRKNWKRYACVAEMVEKYVPDRQSVQLVDYGCGYPVVVKLLRMRGYQVDGFEPYADAEQHRTAAALGVSDHYRTQLAPGDIYHVGLLVDVVEHLAVPAPTFWDVARHLTADALLLVSTPNVLRFEMYWSFVLRRTGHPTALEKYLSSTNSYVHHQRELTMDELSRMLAHFGYKIRTSRFNDVRPDPEDLRDYHAMQGAAELRPGIKGRIFALVKGVLPASVAKDNMLVLAQRTR